MIFIILLGILLPLMGTISGSAFVFAMRKSSACKVISYSDSFAAGVMIAASFFSLIFPALEKSSGEKISEFICITGVFTGIAFFVAADRYTERLSERSKPHPEGLLFFVVTLHNIPEGMAVGVVYSCLSDLSGNGDISAAFALSCAIALQNIPEGAVISLTKHFKGKKKSRAFSAGVVSGIAEFLASCITLIIAKTVNNILPFSLCFAAGAMIYTVMKELSSAFSDNENAGKNMLIFAFSFSLMMLLDIML